MRDVFHLQRVRNRQVFDFVEKVYNLLVGAVPECAQQCRDKELAASAFTVKINIDQVIDIELDLHPGAPVGNDSV